MVASLGKRNSRGSKRRFIGKPTGQIQERVQAVGPERFGILTVDCAKRRSKWMLCDFYSKVLVEPTTVEHTAGGLRAMIDGAEAACQRHGLTDKIVAIEMTGIYHKPVQRAFRKAGWDTRIVHPFASQHYRRALHPDEKTDDHDLEAIFHAASKGYGLTSLPVGEVYQSLQSVARHRQNLVKQQSRLKVQIRRLLHQTMPGFADLFDEDKLFQKSIALPVALEFSSAAAIQGAQVAGITRHLIDKKVRFQPRTIERIVAWASTAAEPSDGHEMLTRQWKELNEIRSMFERSIQAAEQQMAGFLVKTPYVLLLSVLGINVVSAARLAGEAGPIEHYASARAINGRAGLYPSRYQSDEVDRTGGALVRQCNRRLRGAAMQVADNLIKCHPHYRGLSALWSQQKVDPRDRRCRIANRAMRMVYQLVAGRQVWRGESVDRDSLLEKLREFHATHQTPLPQTTRDLHEALAWLPKFTYPEEAKSLLASVPKKRGPQRIGDLMIQVLLRLGITLEEIESTTGNPVKSTTSEARSSH